MRFTAATALVAATLFQSSMAHYCFNKLIVNGNYTGEYEYVRKNNNSNSPITDIDSTDLRCNAGGLSTGNVTSTYKLSAGSEVGFGLDTGIGHPGPVQVYMSKVSTGEDASTYDGSGEWFKVHEIGYSTINSSGIQWATNEIQNFTFTLPEETPAGQYLLRVEGIALHGASTFEGAQFYISCAQIEVTSDSSATPAPDVKIPGVYTGYEPGLMINIYYPIPTNYTFPGPAVWPSDNSTASNTTSVAATSAATTSATTTTASSALPTLSSVTSQIAIVASTGSAAAPSAFSLAPQGYNSTLPTFSYTASGFATSVAPASTGTSSGTVENYGKCGGQGYSGSAQCAQGWTCSAQNEFYSQCLKASSS